MRVRGVMRDKIVIPVTEFDGFDPKDIVDGFSVDSFNDYNCMKCPLVKKRPVVDCETCENYNGRAFLAKKIKDKRGRITHLSFPLGAKAEIERRLDVDLRLRDDRDFAGRTLKRPLKLIRDLYDGSPAPDGTTRVDQIAVVDKWLDHLMGVIWASARSGKTVMAAAISCHVGLRTLIVTDRIDLLKQFRETYIGGERRVRMTDAKPERIIIIDKMSDFLKPHDVALLAYQKMIREDGADNVVRFVKGKYGLLIVDECHMAGADAYSRFLSRLDMPYRLGLSATPRRKDGRYRLADTILGPVVVKTKNVGLKPLIKIHKTGLYGNMRVKAWHAISKLMANDADRNRQITRLVYTLLDAGHSAIIVPLDQVAHIDDVVARINLVARNRMLKNGTGSEIIAIPFYGKTKKRDEVLKEFDKDDSPIQVLVCMRSIIKQGIDVARPSAVLCPIPMSARGENGGPLFSQLSYRASTPVNGKRQPEVIIMADDLPFNTNMVEGLLRSEIMPRSDVKLGPKNCVYKIDPSCHDYLGAFGSKLKREARDGK
jgi:hypothetical protein